MKKVNVMRKIKMLLTIEYSAYASKLNITSVTNLYWMFINCGVQKVTYES